MISLRETMRGGRPIAQSRPWPRHVVDQTGWLRVIREISKGHGDMLGLWSDGADVHMAAVDHESSEFGIVTIECPKGRFPSVGRMHPPALRLERAIRDIYGPSGGWLVRFAELARSWPLGRAASGAKPEPSKASGDAYAFLAAEGAPLHQIPVGLCMRESSSRGIPFSANGEVAFD